MTIGEKIRRLREEKKLSQRALAEAITYSPSYIGDLERNRSTPSIQILKTLASYFQVEMTHFFRKEDVGE